MSKAFTKESTNDDEPDQPEISTDEVKNYVTPSGLSALQTEFKHLLYDERPKVVETVKWAAGNGDRKENGDYIYGKKRLREIDRRIRYLKKRIESAKVVDQALQKHLTKVFFGATVTYAQMNDAANTIQIVGIDEADLKQNKISWQSPLAEALLKAEVGDVVELHTPNGTEKIKVLAIKY